MSPINEVRVRFIVLNILLSMLFGLQGSFAKAEIMSKDKVSIALYSSIGGAVLGLSTLSFYDKPNEHTDNILLGTGLGLIGGLSYIGYKSFGGEKTEEPKPAYDFGVMPLSRNQYGVFLTTNF